MGTAPEQASPVMLVLLPHDSCPLEMLSTPTLSGQTAASRGRLWGSGQKA